MYFEEVLDDYHLYYIVWVLHYRSFALPRASSNHGRLNLSINHPYFATEPRFKTCDLFYIILVYGGSSIWEFCDALGQQQPWEKETVASLTHALLLSQVQNMWPLLFIY